MRRTFGRSLAILAAVVLLASVATPSIFASEGHAHVRPSSIDADNCPLTGDGVLGESIAPGLLSVYACAFDHAGAPTASWLASEVLHVSLFREGGSTPLLEGDSVGGRITFVVTPTFGISENIRVVLVPSFELGMRYTQTYPPLAEPNVTTSGKLVRTWWVSGTNPTPVGNGPTETPGSSVTPTNPPVDTPQPSSTPVSTQMPTVSPSPGDLPTATADPNQTAMLRVRVVRYNTISPQDDRGSYCGGKSRPPRPQYEWCPWGVYDPPLQDVPLGVYKTSRGSDLVATKTTGQDGWVMITLPQGDYDITADPSAHCAGQRGLCLYLPGESGSPLGQNFRRFTLLGEMDMYILVWSEDRPSPTATRTPTPLPTYHASATPSKTTVPVSPTVAPPGFTPSATPTPTSTPVVTPSRTPATQPTVVPGLIPWSGLRTRVPAPVVNSAMANPASVAGYNLRCNPKASGSQFNVIRTCLSLMAASKPYHPVYNTLVWKCGCP